MFRMGRYELIRCHGDLNYLDMHDCFETPLKLRIREWLLRKSPKDINLFHLNGSHCVDMYAWCKNLPIMWVHLFVIMSHIKMWMLDIKTSLTVWTFAPHRVGGEVYLQCPIGLWAAIQGGSPKHPDMDPDHNTERQLVPFRIEATSISQQMWVFLLSFNFNNNALLSQAMSTQQPTPSPHNS